MAFFAAAGSLLIAAGPATAALGVSVPEGALAPPASTKLAATDGVEPAAAAVYEPVDAATETVSVVAAPLRATKSRVNGTATTASGRIAAAAQSVAATAVEVVADAAAPAAATATAGGSDAGYGRTIAPAAAQPPGEAASRIGRGSRGSGAGRPARLQRGIEARRQETQTSPPSKGRGDMMTAAMPVRLPTTLLGAAQPSDASDSGPSPREEPSAFVGHASAAANGLLLVLVALAVFAAFAVPRRPLLLRLAHELIPLPISLAPLGRPG